MDRCYDIPEQILFDILLYLPVMSLLRFKSVCKSWFSLIESSTFIIQHLNHNKDNNLIIYRCARTEFNSLRNARQLLLLSGSQYENCANIDFEGLIWHPTEDIELVGSCNGIICLMNSNWLETALWNPALNQLSVLPQPSAKFTDSSTIDTAFGIDGKTNDYKVLKVFGLRTEKYDLSNQVEVYSLRDNSWKIIHKDSILPFSTDIGTVSPPFINGKCFWITNGTCSPYLLSFDFTDEVFETMSLREGHDELDWIELDIYNDKIAHIRQKNALDPDAFDYKLQIWMLDEFGVKESWNKLYNLVLLDNIDGPIGLSENEEFLICCKYIHVADHYRSLYLYNLHTVEGKFIPYKETCLSAIVQV